MKNIFDILNGQGYVIIAEIGVNYYDIAEKMGVGLLDAAKMMCLEAKKAGADAVKFQTYKAEKIASKYSPSYWDLTEEATSSQFELFKKYDSFEKEDYEEIARYCDEINVCFMSTPFDFEAVDFLEKIMTEYKISSSDLTNLPFIEYICKKNKPILLSVGASNEKEIDEAVNLIESQGNDLVLLHCVLEYPTPLAHANIGRIATLKNKYQNAIIGYSDHTKPTDDDIVIRMAYALGARVFEKHFTLDKTLKGNDHYHSMDSDDLKRIKEHIEMAKELMGNGELSYIETEEMARKNARRSIVLTKSLCRNHTLEVGDIAFKRPGIGISPSEINNVIGKKLINDFECDHILRWEDIT